MDDLARTLAVNLRAARAHRGWTLDELARRSGVSRGMIHQIEAARTNPSVATLAHLCVALDIPVSDLVVLPPQLGHLARRADAVTYPHGAALLLADGRHEVWEHRLAAGAEIPDASGHPAGTREFLHGISGAVTVEIGPAVFEVGAGDTLSLRADRAHTYRNPHAEPAHYLVVVVYHGEHDSRYPVTGSGPTAP
ncbi:helix-turn-helix domain-containing protein [Longispora urticae]